LIWLFRTSSPSDRWTCDGCFNYFVAEELRPSVRIAVFIP
jgi:hypothetical protein